MPVFDLQSSKAVLMLPPVTITFVDTPLTATQISYFHMGGTGQLLATAPAGETNPCEGALFLFLFGALNSPSTSSAYGLVECNTYNGSYTAVSGGTLTVAPADNSFSYIYIMNRGRKPFLKASVTCDSTQTVSVVGIGCPLNHVTQTTAQIGALCNERIIL